MQAQGQPYWWRHENNHANRGKRTTILMEAKGKPC
jgi:hypothetical protein